MSEQWVNEAGIVHDRPMLTCDGGFCVLASTEGVTND